MVRRKLRMTSHAVLAEDFLAKRVSWRPKQKRGEFRDAKFPAPRRRSVGSVMPRRALPCAAAQASFLSTRASAAIAWRCLITCLAACLLGLPGGLVLAAGLVTLDSTAHYPEGPLWRDGKLFYVEYATSNIKIWDGKQATLFWHKDGCGASGLAIFHGHLLVACYDDNSLVELDAAGKQIRALRTDTSGKSFAGPNDFAADGRGGMYFSASGTYDVKAPITGAVLHMSADGSITEVANTIHYANGLTLARDGQHLLVAEMLAGRILSFPVAADGKLGERTVWARLQDLASPTPNEDAYNGPDGLKLGPDGYYYIAQNGSGRVLVVAEDKKLVRTIEVPTPYVTNFAFGGEADLVFITGAFEQWKKPFPGAVYLWRRSRDN
jgi:gluconolactonase